MGHRFAAASLAAWMGLCGVPSARADDAEGADAEGADAEGTDDDDDDDDRSISAVEELFEVELATPQEAGELQVTAAADVLTGPAGEALALTVELEFGLTDWLQVSVGAPMQAWWPAGADGVAGPGDVELGALAALDVGRAILAAAVEVSLPSGDADRGLGRGEVAVEPSLRAAIDAGPVALHALAGLEVEGGEVGVGYGLGVTLPIGAWAVTLEGAGELDDDDRRLQLVPGIVWRGEPVQLGLGMRLLALDDAYDLGASALAVAEF